MTIGRLTDARSRLAVCVAGTALAVCSRPAGRTTATWRRRRRKSPSRSRCSRPVTRYLEATGNTAAVNTTNLVARVQGFLQAIDYKDGDLVKQGATLFIIEPEPYKLKLEQAQAAEAGAQAALKQAEAEYERQAELAGRQVASKAALDNATANRDSAPSQAQAGARSIPSRRRSISATRR